MSPRESDPALPDRSAMLELAAREIIAAWESFDRPRPEESVLDEALARRLLDPLPDAPGDPAEAMHDAARVLDASISPARPLYLAYIGSTGLATGVMASALASTYDVNLAAPAALDHRVCLRVCFVNFRTTDEQVEDVVAVIRELGDRIRAAPRRP